MPLPRAATFAVPGDLTSPTGGYHYDRCLLQALRAQARDVAHLALPDGFPFPAAADMAEAEAQLADVPEGRVLIVDGLALGAINTAALDRLRTPLVALVHHPLAHESGLPEAEARRLQKLEQANLERAEHILVPSPHIKDLLVADFGVDASRITVIRPGKPDIVPLPSADGATNAPPLILSVGILHPRKGHDLFITALAQVADLDWRAVIVGSPWEPGHDAALARQLDAAGLAERVRLAGRIERDALDRLYQEAHVFALATRFEGYGIVFDEALIHGLPIVSTTAGAVPGTVPHAAGKLTAPEDAEAFAASLREILENAATHSDMAAAARRAGAALPSWADAAAEVGRIIDRVAGAKE